MRRERSGPTGRASRLLAGFALVFLFPAEFVRAQQQDAAPQPLAAAAVSDPSLPGIAAPDAALDAELSAARKAKGPAYEPRGDHRNADGAPKYTNRLIRETSPYLLQHAHNPVNWYPWGDEAFERAARENKPVFLSIGYSTCHWCHVMEHESFEDEEIARFLNENFVSIKVDREERPNVDDVYMQAVQMMTGGGGWPMSLALTPAREPFFGGTYLPARDGDRGARKGFLTVLRELSDLYRNERERVTAQAAQISRQLAGETSAQPAGDIPAGEAVYLAASRLARSYDPERGGFGRAPKFPRSSDYELLLRFYRRTGDEQARAIVERSLERMVSGGMYDQIGGGFHRYSVDADWLVPHFEKMLYDNAQLASLYLDAALATGRADFARIATETLEYVAREMTAPAGGFYAATDADSVTASGELMEGAFFTWTQREIVDVLGAEQGKVAIAYFGVPELGKLDGRSVLRLPQSADAVAQSLGTSSDALRKEIDAIRPRLYEARSRRPNPLRDDKIIASWNGLMIGAFARGSLVLGRPDFAQHAIKAARFLLDHMRDADGALLRSWASGRGGQPGTLDDQAFVVQGLLDLYEATSDLQWLDAALSLQKVLDDRFFDDENGGYFLTAHAQPTPLLRRKPDYDGAEPAGNSVAISNLLRLGEYTADQSLRARAETCLRAFAEPLRNGSLGLSKMLGALELYVDEPLEIVIVVAPEEQDVRDQMLAHVRSTYVPNRTLSVVPAGAEIERQAARIPLLQGKHPRSGHTTAFVCKNHVCQFPTSNPDTFARQLEAKTPLFREGTPPRLFPPGFPFGL